MDSTWPFGARTNLFLVLTRLPITDLFFFHAAFLHLFFSFLFVFISHIMHFLFLDIRYFYYIFFVFSSILLALFPLPPISPSLGLLPHLPSLFLLFIHFSPLPSPLLHPRAVASGFITASARGSLRFKCGSWRRRREVGAKWARRASGKSAWR